MGRENSGNRDRSTLKEGKNPKSKKSKCIPEKKKRVQGKLFSSKKNEVNEEEKPNLGYGVCRKVMVGTPKLKQGESPE